jgi:hypothetical protein
MLTPVDLVTNDVSEHNSLCNITPINRDNIENYGKVNAADTRLYCL